MVFTKKAFFKLYNGENWFATAKLSLNILIVNTVLKKITIHNRIVSLMDSCWEVSVNVGGKTIPVSCGEGMSKLANRLHITNIRYFSGTTD